MHVEQLNGFGSFKGNFDRRILVKITPNSSAKPNSSKITIHKTLIINMLKIGVNITLLSILYLF